MMLVRRRGMQQQQQQRGNNLNLIDAAETLKLYQPVVHSPRPGPSPWVMDSGKVMESSLSRLYQLLGPSNASTALCHTYHSDAWPWNRLHLLHGGASAGEAKSQTAAAGVAAVISRVPRPTGTR
jgi:hypothetical protein